MQSIGIAEAAVFGGGFPQTVFDSGIIAGNSAPVPDAAVFTPLVTGLYRVSATVWATTASSSAWTVGAQFNVPAGEGHSGFNTNQQGIATSVIGISPVKNTGAYDLFQVTAGDPIHAGTFTSSGANTGGVYSYRLVIERIA